MRKNHNPRLPCAGVLPVLLLAACLANPPAAHAGDLASASLEALVKQATRSASSAEEQGAKEAARNELIARGGTALRFLMERAHIRNVTLQVLIDQVATRLDGEEGAPVLLDFLAAPRPRTRKLAAYYLGVYDTPQYQEQLLPLLDDDKAAAATLRTLGKWKAAGAVPQIMPFLSNEKERKRVAAANALRDIGDPAAIPSLIGALGDEVFTVRNAALRAVVSFGDAAVSPLEAAVADAEPTAQRQIIRALGRIGDDSALDIIKPFLGAGDWGVRGDAARALLRLAPEQAEEWYRDTAAAPEAQPFVSSAFAP